MVSFDINYVVRFVTVELTYNSCWHCMESNRQANINLG